MFGATLVRGRPFYGFHAEDAVFAKVMLLSPRDVGKAARLLESGAVLGRKFQPYESHIPYLLQFKARLPASLEPACYCAPGPRAARWCGSVHGARRRLSVSGHVTARCELGFSPV